MDKNPSRLFYVFFLIFAGNPLRKGGYRHGLTNILIIYDQRLKWLVSFFVFQSLVVNSGEAQQWLCVAS